MGDPDDRQAYPVFMRAAAGFVLLGLLLPLFAAPALSTSCITVPIDVRRAEVVVEARYAGARTFVVESVLRTVGDSPETLIAPEDWRASQCAPREPVAGQAYLVARYDEGLLLFADYESTAAERALIDRLHAVTASEILDALGRYSRGERNSDEMGDWLQSAMVDWTREYSFTNELLNAAESLISDVWALEPCNRDLIRTIRADELPLALGAIAEMLPEVDAENEYVEMRLTGVFDPELRRSLGNEAVNEWEEGLDALREAIKQMQRKLEKLPWCDHEKHGS